MSLQVNILFLKNHIGHLPDSHYLPSILLIKNLRSREVMMFSRSYLYTFLHILIKLVQYA